ncbi:DUF6745 domain-containing protein [Micromonospora saelicesensis]|uniref:DUF6745 domain-containing protein n=1 Tax=Micromonospora saelicesensis TaxID=285676 RepID=UPI003CE7FF81
MGRASDTERFSALGEFHSYCERKGFYGEQHYDGVDERYDLMERPYRCLPVLPSERSALRPVLHTLHLPARPQPHVGGDRPFGHRPLRAPTGLLLGRGAGARDQDDEACAVIRYSTPDLNDRFFVSGWCYYPDLMVLATRDAYRSYLGVGLDPARQACRDVALTTGPWWPSPSTDAMSERPILLTLNERGRPHSDAGPAIQWIDGHQVWASEGAFIRTARLGSTPRGG